MSFLHLILCRTHSIFVCILSIYRIFHPLQLFLCTYLSILYYTIYFISKILVSLWFIVKAAVMGKRTIGDYAQWLISRELIEYLKKFVNILMSITRCWSYFEIILSLYLNVADVKSSFVSKNSIKSFSRLL